MPHRQQREPYLRSRPPTTALNEMLKESQSAEMGHPHEITILKRRPVVDDAPPPTATPSPDEAKPGEAKPGDAPEPATGTDAILVEIRTLLQQLNDNLFNKPGTPRSIAGHVSTSDSEYIEVANWTIPPNQVGQVEEISFTSDEPGIAQWKLTIRGVEQWADLHQQDALNVRFPSNNELNGDDEMVLEVRSDGATVIDADASISGIERVA